MLELDLNDNAYSRFIKKGKSVKDKSTAGTSFVASNNHHLSGAKTRSSMANNATTALGTGLSGYQTGGIAALGRYFMPDASTLAPVLSTLGASGGKGINHNNILALNLCPFFSRLCPFHQNLERFLANRFNLALIPNGPLNPNAFLKGLRTFNNWRSETKNSLMNDLI